MPFLAQKMYLLFPSPGWSSPRLVKPPRNPIFFHLKWLWHRTNNLLVTWCHHPRVMSSAWRGADELFKAIFRKEPHKKTVILANYCYHKVKRSCWMKENVMILLTFFLSNQRQKLIVHCIAKDLIHRYSKTYLSEILQHFCILGTDAKLFEIHSDSSIDFHDLLTTSLE